MIEPFTGGVMKDLAQFFDIVARHEAESQE